MCANVCSCRLGEYFRQAVDRHHEPLLASPIVLDAAQAAFLVALWPLFLRAPACRGPMFPPVVAPVRGTSGGPQLTSRSAQISVMPIATANRDLFVRAAACLTVAGQGCCLAERRRPRRSCADGVGLIGAMIVIRPGFSTYVLVHGVGHVISAFAYSLIH